MHIIVTNLSDWMLTLIEENNGFSDKHSLYSIKVVKREIYSFAYNIAHYNLSALELDDLIDNKTEFLFHELGYTNTSTAMLL